jgi:hypothetical protein
MSLAQRAYRNPKPFVECSKDVKRREQAHDAAEADVTGGRIDRFALTG